LRTGGLEASAFPSAEVVALALSTCLKGGVPFKATAGLHHPFPKFDSTVQATMHGFVNLFAAAALGHARRLGPAEVQAILEDADPAHFAFTEEGLRWRGLEVNTAEIEFARTVAVMPFGSCSFDEPRDDLRALGWL
jgi:inactivated superfamily I helicase